MKKKLLFFCLVILSFTSQAQWSMTTSTATYSDLANPVSLNNGAVWNQATNYPITLPFAFNLSGQLYSALNVKAGGGLNFPGAGFRELFIFHTPFGGYLLTDRGNTTSLSELGYETTGNAGQRVFKLQWKNAGFTQSHPTSSPNDLVNFQIWLFESDNHVEVHFGPNTATPATYGYPVTQSNPNPGPSIKFLFDQCQNTMGLTGPANSPYYTLYNTCNPNYSFVDGTPANGVVYNFFSTVTGIPKLIESDFEIFPNPVRQVLHVANLSSNISIKGIIITDLIGRTVYQERNLTTDKTFLIPINQIKDGVYLLKLETKDGKAIVRKIIKNN